MRSSVYYIGRRRYLPSIAQIVVIVISIATLLFGLFSFFASQHTARAIQPDGFPCDGTFYQSRFTSTPSDSLSIYRINRTSIPYTSTAIAPNITGDFMNGLAYNPVDGYLYMWNTENNNLVVINNTGTIIASKPVSPSPPADVTAATIDQNGVYYFGSEQTSGLRYYSVDTTSAAPTLTMTTHTLTSTDSPAMTAMSAPGDMVIDPQNTDTIYVSIWTSLYTINRSAGTMSRVGTSGSLGTSFGTLFMDASGTLYGYANTGAFYQMSKTNGTTTLLNTADPATASDGGGCVFPEASIDTVKAVNGAVQRQNATTFRIPYIVQVGNTSSNGTPATNIQVTEDLSKTFVTGSPAISISSAPTVTSGSCTAHTSFNGLSDTKLLSGNDTLYSTENCTITFTVELTYSSQLSVPSSTQMNAVYASASSLTNNQGYTFNSSGDPTPPVQLIAADISTNSPSLPLTSHADTPSLTPVLLETPGLIVHKSVSPVGGPITVGDALTYTVTLQNNGNTTLQATATDNLVNVLHATTIVSGSLTAVSSIPGNTPAVPTVSGTTLSWNDFVQSNELITLTYAVTVNSSSYGATILNSVSASATTPSSESVASNCTSGSESGCWVSSTVETLVDLAITTTTPSQVTAGDTVPISYRVRNNGPSTSTGSVMSVTLPSILTAASTSTPGCTISGSVVTCTIGALTVGGEFVIELVATTSSTVGTCGNLTPGVLTSEAETTLSNNTTSTQTCIIAASISQPDSDNNSETTEKTLAATGQATVSIIYIASSLMALAVLILTIWSRLALARTTR